MPKVAINGLGRIGKLIFKTGLEKGLNIIAINDLTDVKTLAYLLKYDSVYGRFKGKINFGKDFLKINNKKILVFSEPDPEKLPWKKLGIDYVVESTGAFRDREKASKHLKAGAKKVIVSATCKGSDITIVLGANDNKLTKSHKIISMASCTTNCLAPISKVLNDKFGIKKAFMTTVHAYTSSQALVDAPKRKLRRGRAAAVNIVPTTSGATTATSETIPKLKGKIDGLAFRVPVVNGSIVDFVAELNKKVTKNQINNAFKQAAKGSLKGILEYSEDELVSSDIIGNSHSAIVDGLSTQVISDNQNKGNSGNLIKVLAWYDNEYGYCNRMVELLKRLR